ncbi:MAG TPA: hypothetical protein VFO69_06020 [Allosphingosinicella sp.]|nr:hypothetical protein [Allosphingosinicella sp.]
MDDRERVEIEPERRVEHETTVINTGERSGGSGGLIAAIVLLLVVAILAFLFFSGSFDQAADEVGVNVNVEAPDITIPEVEVPDVDIDVTPSDEGGSNSN